MADIDGLKITIDRDACIGDGACCEEAPATFELDGDEIAVVKSDSKDSRETIIDAAKNCPTDAIIIEDRESGEQLAP
ncbi:MAG: ferredoxin [Planctomycetota bacterium]